MYGIPPIYQRPKGAQMRTIASHSERLFLLRVFGRVPVTGMMRYSEAGARKASREETAGEFAPAVVSVYGDLAPVYTLIFGLRTGTTAEQLPRRGFWSPCAGSERWSRGERSAFWRSKAALTVAVGGEWPSAMRYRPGTGAAMWDDGRSVLVMNCRSR